MGAIPTVRSQTTRLGRSRQSIAVVLKPDIVAKPESERPTPGKHVPLKNVLGKCTPGTWEAPAPLQSISLLETY